jgi:hypothetical protein
MARGAPIRSSARIGEPTRMDTHSGCAVASPHPREDAAGGKAQYSSSKTHCETRRQECTAGQRCGNNLASKRKKEMANKWALAKTCVMIVPGQCSTHPPKSATLWYWSSEYSVIIQGVCTAQSSRTWSMRLAHIFF